MYIDDVLEEQERALGPLSQYARFPLTAQESNRKDRDSDTLLATFPSALLYFVQWQRKTAQSMNQITANLVGSALLSLYSVVLIL